MAEKVYTVDDYHDQPILGTADFQGSPHYYTRIFDERRMSTVTALG